MPLLLQNSLFKDRKPGTADNHIAISETFQDSSVGFCNSASWTMIVDENDEYAKLIRRMNSPRVVIDNDACEHATIVQVDTMMNRQGTLLEVVQVLTDLNFVITKAYISSDGGWFMDVFYVTDKDGNKITDKGIFGCIQEAIETDPFANPTRNSTGLLQPSEEQTVIELAGSDRPGLLSEVSAVLTDLKCNVVNAEFWTHNATAAAVIHINDQSTGCAIADPNQLNLIKELLSNVLNGNGDSKARMSVSSSGEVHTGRRLHQMMYAARDFERLESLKDPVTGPCVNVSDCIDRDYTVVTIRSLDRPKLLFDTICVLTDMQYVVFHGAVVSGTKEAYQEYYIRHVDGLPISSEPERQRVMECLEAAIMRRAAEGLELQLCTDDSFGLLSDVTRILREHGLCIKRAKISTKDGKVKDTFFVTDLYGNSADPKSVNLVQEQIGQAALQVQENSKLSPKFPQETSRSFLLGSFFRVGRSFQNFGLAKSGS